MRSITIDFKDGTRKTFTHRGRAGGSYTISIKYEGEWVIIKDEWGGTEAYPAADVKRVQTEEFTRW